MSDLRNCPFCGSKAEANIWEPVNDYPGNQTFRYVASVKCSSSKCNAYQGCNGEQYRTEEEALNVAVGKWNIRNTE